MLRQADRPHTTRSFAARLFGYDVFVSFALGGEQRGTRAYASDLARRLRELDFTVFFSEQEAPAGAELEGTLLTALRRSRTLVVVANRGTLREPRWVRQEVEVFRRDCPGRAVVPISIDGALQDESIAADAKAWLGHAGRIWIDETQQAAEAGAASDVVVNRLATAPSAVRSSTRLRWLVGATIVTLAALASVAAWQAVRAAREADAAIRESRAARAALSGQLATHSQLALDRYPQRSLLLAVAALKVTSDRGEPRVVAAEEALRGALASAGGQVVQGPDKPVSAIELSPDGRWLALAAADGRAVSLRDLNRPGTDALALSEGTAVAFSADSRRLAVAGHSNLAAQLWDVSGAQPKPVRRLDAAAPPLIFSPDSHRLATGGTDATPRVWRLDDAQSEPLVLAKQVNPTPVMVFSPDGRWLATGSWHPRANRGETEVARLWDLAATDPRSTVRELGAPASSLSHFVYTPDSRKLAAASAEYDSHTFRLDPRVYLWNLERPDVPPTVLADHASSVTALAVGADGRRLASGGTDGSVRLWDLAAADPASAPLRVPDQAQDIVGLAVGAHQLFTLGGTRWQQGPDRIARASFWDIGALEKASARKPERFTITRPDDALTADVLTDAGRPVAVQTFRIGPDGRGLLLAGASTVYRLDLGDRDPLRSVLAMRGHEGEVTLLAAAVDKLASAGSDRAVRLWPLAPARFGAQPLTMRGNVPGDSALSADSRWLVTIGAPNPPSEADHAAELWDLAAPAPRAFRLGGHGQAIHDAAVSPDGRWVATAAHDGRVRLWRLADGGPSGDALVLSGHQGVVWTVEFSPDGRRLASGGFDRTVRLWDLGAADPSQGALRLETGDSVSRVAFVADGRKLVASGPGEKPPTIWDLRAGDVAASARPLPDAEGTADASPDGRWLVTSATDERRALHQQMQATRDVDEQRALAKRIATFSPAMSLWDLRAEPLQRHPLPGARDRVVFAPDGRWLVTAGADDVPRLWKLDQAAPVAVELRGHAKTLESAALSRDGRWLATGGYDGSALLWDLSAADIAKSSQVLPSHANGVDTLAFASDGSVLFSAGDVARLVPVAPDRPGPSLTLPSGKGRLSNARFTRDGRWLVAYHHDQRVVTVWSMELRVLIDLACRTAGRQFDDAERRLYGMGERAACDAPR
jgi:WD40 repeat protein